MQMTVWHVQAQVLFCPDENDLTGLFSLNMKKNIYIAYCINYSVTLVRYLPVPVWVLSLPCASVGTGPVRCAVEKWGKVSHLAASAWQYLSTHYVLWISERAVRGGSWLSACHMGWTAGLVLQGLSVYRCMYCRVHNIGMACVEHVFRVVACVCVCDLVLTYVNWSSDGSHFFSCASGHFCVVW